MNRRLSARSWSAPVPWRFRSRPTLNSARGLAHSKTLTRFLLPMRDSRILGANHEPGHSCPPHPLPLLRGEGGVRGQRHHLEAEQKLPDIHVAERINVFPL